MYKYIGFDLFGTLFFLEDAINNGNVLKETLDASEYEVFSKNWLDWHRNSYGLEIFLHNINQELNFSLNESKLNQIISTVTIEKPELYPDVLPSLKNLVKANYNLVLFTNSPPTAKNLFENEQELSKLFKKTFWSFENGFMKPEPEAFNEIIRNLNVKKSELLYVGDSYDQDYLGGKNFGIDVLLLDRFRKFPKVMERINSLLEINKLL